MLAVSVRVRSLILASVVGLFILHQVGSFAAPFGLGAAALARCVFIWIVASIERAIALYHHGKSKKQSSLQFCPATMYFFRGAAGSRQVSLWSCGRCAMQGRRTRSGRSGPDPTNFFAFFFFLLLKAKVLA